MSDKLSWKDKLSDAFPNALLNDNKVNSKELQKIPGFSLLRNKAQDFHWKLVGNKYFQARYKLKSSLHRTSDLTFNEKKKILYSIANRNQTFLDQREELMLIMLKIINIHEEIVKNEKDYMGIYKQSFDTLSLIMNEFNQETKDITKGLNEILERYLYYANYLQSDKLLTKDIFIDAVTLASQKLKLKDDLRIREKQEDEAAAIEAKRIAEKKEAEEKKLEKIAKRKAAEAEKALEKERIKQERREQLLRQFNIKQKEFFNNKYETNYEEIIDLQNKDLRLISIWLNMSGLEADSLNNKSQLIEKAKEQQVKEFDITKMISARCAERIAIKFYTNLREEPIDYSIQQTHNDSNNSEWQLCDIKSQNLNIDVKNARTSARSDSSYSEQFVKNFKSDKNKNNVIYLGTLSKYKTLTKELENDNINVKILGEVTQKDIHDLQTWIRGNYSSNFTIDLSRVGDNNRTQIGNFIPGWMFEYPKDFYEDQCKTFLNFEQLLEWKKLNNINKDMSVPLSIIGDKSYRADEERYPYHHDLINSLLKMRDSIGISRRTIYLLVLAYTIHSLKNKNDYNPERWNYVIFDENNTAPLGLYDPECYIFNLIDLLQKLWERNKDALLKYESFKLSGPNILKGIKPNSHDETIIAFCGGWDKYKNIKCGKNPLFLGDSKTCQKCGYLICPEEGCKTCNEYCEENDRRLNKIDLEADLGGLI
tara:strand:+ start:32 stop:2152 length:2121 start_codon:yes stop_codon:yes gene_type:complete